LSKHVVVLTYNYLRSLEPAPPPKPGQKYRNRYFVDDALVPGLKVQVTDTGHLSYGMNRRWPGHKQPTWRRIGDVYVPPKTKTENDIDVTKIEHEAGTLTILEARNVARAWLDQLSRKVDPKATEMAQKAEEKRLAEEAVAAAEREKATRFGVVAIAFNQKHVSTLAKTREVSRIVKDIYVTAWGDRPITAITPVDVLAVIKPIVDRGAKYEALNVFRIGARLYSWAAGSPEYETKGHNPFKGLSPKTIIGETPARSRWLKPNELRAVWKGAGQIGGPHEAVVKLLILTTKRLNEVARLSWGEVDLDDDHDGADAKAIIPARRMKGRKAPDHLLPLAPEAAKILRDIPHGSAGDFVFTTSGGKKPISLGDKIKKRVDELSGVRDWIFHDLRRTGRTHLSALPIEEHVREAILAHTRKGIAATYDIYEYQAEKRRGLELLEKRLMAIVEPAAVTELDAARHRRAS
jgi:integrase